MAAEIKSHHTRQRFSILLFAQFSLSFLFFADSEPQCGPLLLQTIYKVQSVFRDALLPTLVVTRGY